MRNPNRLTEDETRHCIAAAEAFSKQDGLWSNYLKSKADIADIDFDLEISSESATRYMIFVNNKIRPWLRKISPKVDASPQMFAVFHERIETLAKSVLEG